MNSIDFEHYRRTGKIILYEPKHANDNFATTQRSVGYLFSENGEQLAPGERGQLVIVDSYGRCSCADM